MNYILEKQNINDEYIYSLEEIGLSLSDTKLKCSDIVGNIMYVFLGNLGNDMIPIFFKINLNENTLSPIDLIVNYQDSSLEFQGIPLTSLIQRNASYKGFIQNDNFYTIINSPILQNKPVLITINLNSKIITFKKIVHISIPENTVILDIELIENNLFFIAKSENLDYTTFNRLYSVNLQTFETLKYDIDALGIIGESTIISNNKTIYFIGGKYLNKNTNLTDIISNRIISLNTTTRTVGEISFSESPISLPNIMLSPNALFYNNKIMIVPQKEEGISQRYIFIFNFDTLILSKEAYEESESEGLIFNVYKDLLLTYNPFISKVWYNKIPNLLSLISPSGIQFSMEQKRKINDKAIYFDTRKYKITDSIFVTKLISQRVN